MKTLTIRNCDFNMLQISPASESCFFDSDKNWEPC